MVEPERRRDRHVTVVLHLNHDSPWCASRGYEREVELETLGVTRIVVSKEIENIKTGGGQVELAFQYTVHQHSYPRLRVE